MRMILWMNKIKLNVSFLLWLFLSKYAIPLGKNTLRDTRQFFLGHNL